VRRPTDDHPLPRPGATGRPPATGSQAERTGSIAAHLHVHPQTVRYRIARLRELLGGAMDTPAGRFELDLALRIDRALTPAGG
jgi:PucR C-terminal helix-turn-helix domain